MGLSLGTPCTIVTLTASGVNDHGETTYDIDNVQTVCHLNVTGTDEVTSPDQRATSTGKVYLHADEVVNERSRIVVAGISYDVAGIPVERRRAPSGQVHHLEVPVKVAR